MRPYPPNWRPPQGYAISPGTARLLERIWQPAQLDDPACWEIYDADAAAGAAELLSRDPCPIDKEPDSHNEAIRWQDTIHRADADTMPGIYEIARMIVVEQGAGVIERIQTWARISAIDPQTGLPAWTTELRAPPDSLTAFGGLGLTASSSAPFIFPLPHPVSPTSPLRIIWSLRLDRMGIEDRPAIDYVAGAPPGSIPPGDRPPHLPGDWEDMRFCWGTWPAKGHQWIVGGYSLVRLFATVIGDPALWQVSIAGRLTGYTQNAGTLARCLENVTRRA